MGMETVGVVPVSIDIECGENRSCWTGELGCKGDEVINGVVLLLDEAACWSTCRRIVYSSSRVEGERDSGEAEGERGICFDIEMPELSASIIVESSAGAMVVIWFIILTPML